MRTPAILLAALVAQFSFGNTLTPKEIDEGWISLFDGETLFGWSEHGEAKWKVVAGALTADGSAAGWLRSGSVFADYVLKCEFKTSAKGNSGIFLRSAKDGQPHVTGYELQIWNDHPKFPTGSLVNHVATKRPAKLRGDVWNSFEVSVFGNSYQVKLNGKRVLDANEGKTRIGYVGLQVNRDHPIQFRNIKLRMVGWQSLFNGKDLSGWRKVDAPKAQQPPVWSVKAGALHVEKGPGQIETEASYEDFALQLAIRTNPASPEHHPNSGVFLRGDPNSFWTGYESQIRNEFKSGDRSQPVDFGTGGIYFHSPTRKVVANDGEYFVKTIIARGRHFGVWINGYPVTDWEDPHPQGKIVRNKQAKLEPGAISLQAHDPTTNLDFKNIRLIALPK